MCDINSGTSQIITTVIDLDGNLTFTPMTLEEGENVFSGFVDDLSSFFSSLNTNYSIRQSETPKMN